MRMLEGGVDTLVSSMVRVSCSLVHCCVVAGNADLNIGDG